MRHLYLILLGTVLLCPGLTAQTHSPSPSSVIFFHPDGSGLNHWNAARMYWYGPDGHLNWDQLPYMAIYRGHMEDRLVGTSHGGATVHAFGYKVHHDSFGQDNDRKIKGRSGFGGSVLREAAHAGMPVGLVNDGDLAEPGTAVFASEVDLRYNSTEIARQLLDGRPGFEGEPRPVVMLAGGEGWFLPAEAPRGEDADNLNIHLHRDPFFNTGPTREDGRNLLKEFAEAGYEIVRTRAQFEALNQRLEENPDWTPRVLGLFARDDIFNDRPEEMIIRAGLLEEEKAGTKEGRLILWGSRPGTPGYNPPTAAEMNRTALEILRRHAAAAGKPFLLISEVESTDNLPNNTNAIGMLRALKRADDSIGVLRAFIDANPETLLLTAADSDGGGPQVFSPPPTDSEGMVTVSGGNPTGVEGNANEGFPLDGIEGHGTRPFTAEQDAFGNRHEFAIGFTGYNDVAGAIISRAEGANASLLQDHFRGRFDSTDVYRMIYAGLFGELLPLSYGERAPSR